MRQAVSHCDVDVGPCKTPPQPLPCQASVAAAEALAHHARPQSSWENQKPTTADRRWICIWHCLNAGLSAQRSDVVPPHSTDARNRTSLGNLETRHSGEASLSLLPSRSRAPSRQADRMTALQYSSASSPPPRRRFVDLGRSPISARLYPEYPVSCYWRSLLHTPSSFHFT